MNNNTNFRQTTARHERQGNRAEQYSWFFMRISGLILLVAALIHLFYMHFVIPGGVSAIDYAFVAARWTDPTWGFFWRFFDLLLLVFGVTHGTNGLRHLIGDYVHLSAWRNLARAFLYLICLSLIVTGGTIIFSFQAVGLD